jgi:acetolactate synthase I/II/III large subunit
MKLTDFVADVLSKEVKHVFCGQGGVVIHILDSIYKHPGLKLVPCENEQGASIAAESYSRVNRNLGVAVATSGPGMINLMQGIACAYYDSIPTLYISGASPTNHLKGSRKVRQLGFQEMEVIKIVESLSKYSVLLTDAKKVRYELEKLLYMAKEGRPGPVMLDLPDDLQRADIDPNQLEAFVPPKKKIKDHKKDIAKALKMIEVSERPIIVVGSGVKLSKTENLMKKFIEKSGIPVATTWSTIDMFVEDDPNLIGNFGISANRYGNFAVQTADLIISFGSRLDTHETGSNPKTFAPKAKKVMIDIDPHEMNRNNGMTIDLKIEADLRDFLDQLRSADIKTKDLSKWKNRIKGWRKKYPICDPKYYDQKEKVNPYVFMNELSKLTKEGAIIITDAGGTLTWTMQSYKVRVPQMLFSAFNHSPMGYALPASIGAQFAAPDKQVVCITGDGGMNMNIQELETVLFNKLPIKIFVVDNNEYGIIKQTQDTWMKSQYVGSDETSGLGFPDLIAIAKAYGFETSEINNHSELASKAKDVLSKDKPMFCDVRLKHSEQILPKLVFGRPIEDMAPLLDREEFKKNLEF